MTKKINIRLVFILTFVFCTTKIKSQTNDSTYFNCTCNKEPKKHITHAVFNKVFNDTMFIINFNINSSRNDTLIKLKNKFFLKNSNRKFLAIDLSDKKPKDRVYLGSNGLGYNMRYNGDTLINKKKYWKYFFWPMITHVSNVGMVIMSSELKIVFFTMFDGVNDFVCSKIE